jgi:periplasmic protein TonB
VEQEPVPQPRRQPKQALVTKPPAAPRTPAPQTPAPKPPAPPKPSDFPAPMNFSFGPTGPRVSEKAPTQHAARQHFPGTIDMSLGPASLGEANPTPFGDRDEDAVSADWRNALSRWVAEHAYYPPQAIHELQEGDAKVHVIALPNGKVKEVELIGKSGSMWLDMALVALFRDQHIPPLPSGETDPVEFNFTMHYILQVLQSGGGGGRFRR